MCVDGDDTRPLLPLDPFAFSGESQVSCTLLGGAIRDFNLIYAPQRYAARLQWMDAATPQRLFSSAHTVLVFSAGQHVHVGVGNTSHEHLGRYDCLQLSGNRQLLEITVTGLCCVIELTPV